MTDGEALAIADRQRGLKRSLHIRHLDSGSCNGCDWELTALLNPVYDIQRLGIDFVASPRHADLLLVTGVMTRNLAEAARLTYEAMPEPRLVVAVGACAVGGGVFAQTYAAAGETEPTPAGGRLRTGLSAAPGSDHPRAAPGRAAGWSQSRADGALPWGEWCPRTRVRRPGRGQAALRKRRR